MNKKRRENLVKSVGFMNDASAIIKDALSQEESCYDNTPENLQMSARYEDMEIIIDALQEAADCLSSAIEKTEEAIYR